MLKVLKGKRYALGDKPFLLLTILYLLYAVLTFAFTAVFEGEDYHVIPFDIIGDFGGLLLANLILGGFILFIGVKYFKAKPNYFILGLLLIAFICNTIALAYFPSTFNWINDFTYNLETSRRYEYIFMFLNTCLFLYISYTIAPYCRKKENSWKLVYQAVIIFTLFVIVFSYFSDYDSYHYFWESRSDISVPTVQSFTGQKNVFGVIVLFGMFAECMMMYFDHKWWRIFFILYFLVHEWISGCRSCLAAGVALCFILFLYLIFDFRRRSKKLMYLVFGGFIAIAAILAVCIFVPYFWKISIFEKIYYKLIGLFSGEQSTFQSRLVVWNHLWTLLRSDNMYFVFGLGSANFNRAFFFAADNPGAKVWHTHNGYLMPFGEGGLIRGIISLLVDLYILYKIFDIYRKYKDKSVRLYGAFFVAYLIRITMEPEYLFTTEWSSLFFINFISVPLLAIEARNRLEKVEKVEIERPTNYPLYHLIFMLPALMISVGCINQTPYIRYPLIAGGLVIQVVGLLISNKKEFNKFTIIYVAILDVLVAAEGIVCSYLYAVDVAHYLFALIFVLVLMFVLHLFFIEYGLFPNCLRLIVDNERGYSLVIRRQARGDKSIGYLEDNPADHG